MTVNGRCHARCQWVEGHNGPHNFGPAARAAGIDVERLWGVLQGIGVIENGTWVNFQRKDAERMVTEYRLSRLAGEGER